MGTAAPFSKNLVRVYHCPLLSARQQGSLGALNSVPCPQEVHGFLREPAFNKSSLCKLPTAITEISIQCYRKREMNPAWEQVHRKNSPKESQRLGRAESRVVPGAADRESYMELWEMVAWRGNSPVGLQITGDGAKLWGLFLCRVKDSKLPTWGTVVV